MLYDYKCKQCGKILEISKPHEESSREELCVQCGAVMDRIFTVSHVVISNSYNSNILGGNTDRNSITEMQKRYHDRTGSEMVPVGTDNGKVEAKRHSYEVPREILAKAAE